MPFPDRTVKILIVGLWSFQQYEQSFARALSFNGVDVVPLPISHFFKGFWGRILQAIPMPTFALFRLNRAVIRAVRLHQPDFVLFWRPIHFFPATLKMISKMGVRTISYNNDDPFGPKSHSNVPWHHHALWHWYITCLPSFDYNFFYRQINCVEAMAHGATHADILLPYFIPWRDRPVRLTDKELPVYKADAVFVGHYESDNRKECIRALVLADVSVKIWGGGYWNRHVLGEIYDKLAPILPAEGDSYSKALCGAKVCLCFLSKLNRDTYTRRCFEIPACGKVLLAERTDDLRRLFKEDYEACFFSSPEELVRKVKWLLSNHSARERIARAGLFRVWSAGHDVNSRARDFIRIIS